MRQDLDVLQNPADHIAKPVDADAARKKLLAADPQLSAALLILRLQSEQHQGTETTVMNSAQ